MKTILVLLPILLFSFSTVSCGKKEKSLEKEPKVSQMKAICELAVMDCYYHNVAKYFEEDASGALFWKKDKNFWIEYSGVVRLGIDASQIEMQIKGNRVTITLPKAKVMNCPAEPNALSNDSIIIASDSADVDAQDQKRAFEEAQNNMKAEAENDTALLANAQQRVQNLLEEYVKNIGNAVGKEYSISWKYKEEPKTEQSNKGDNE